jgi:hypothetical protein
MKFLSILLFSSLVHTSVILSSQNAATAIVQQNNSGERTQVDNLLEEAKSNLKSSNDLVGLERSNTKKLKL